MRSGKSASWQNSRLKSFWHYYWNRSKACPWLIKHCYHLWHLWMAGVWWEGSQHHLAAHLWCPLDEDLLLLQCQGALWCPHETPWNPQHLLCLLSVQTALQQYMGWHLCCLWTHLLPLNCGGSPCWDEDLGGEQDPIVMVEGPPIPFSPFSLADCTMISHFLFNDFVAVAFPDLVGDLDTQI